MRIDLLLVSLGLAPSRNKAQELIHHGDVEIQVDGKWRIVNQPSFNAVNLTKEHVRLRSDGLLQYVSRGGIKLQGVLDTIGLDVSGLTVLDVGISTGGFADCVLQRGAAAVIGVDVGSGQLARKLQNDPRVKSFENINARELRNHSDVIHLLPPVSLCVVDVSFISLTLILPELAFVLPPHHLLALIKPQFELSAQALGKDGIVGSDKDQKIAQDRVTGAAQQAGYQIFAIIPAALKGTDGNQEFFLYAQHGVE